MIAVKEESVSVKSVRRGLRRVSYVDAKREGIVSTASSVRRVYSVCSTSQSAGTDRKGTTYFCDAKEIFYPGPEFFTCDDAVQCFSAINDPFGMCFQGLAIPRSTHVSVATLCLPQGSKNDLTSRMRWMCRRQWKATQECDEWFEMGK